MPTSSPITHALADAMADLGASALVFGLVLLPLSLLLSVLFSPGRFPVHLGNKTVHLADLASERATLLSKEASAREEQARLERRVPTPTLHQIATLRRGIVPVGSSFFALIETQKSFRLGDANPVHLTGVAFDRRSGRIRVAGNIDDRGSGSIRLLAAFVDALRQSGSFTSVSEPEYEQKTDAEHGTYSPFSITLILPHER